MRNCRAWIATKRTQVLLSIVLLCLEGQVASFAGEKGLAGSRAHQVSLGQTLAGASRGWQPVWWTLEIL